MPSIRDVAKRLNLSITTVSRALDGYSDVAEGTRQIVIQTAEQMGYVPNRAARQLRRQRSDTIGFILPAPAPQFADPYFSEFIAGLGDEANSSQFDLLVATAPPNSEMERRNYERWVNGRKVDGIVLNRMRLRDWRVQFLAQKMPFVSLERTLDRIPHASIEVDSQAGLRALMGHLVRKGHRRIAYVRGPVELKIEADRFMGYLAGLTEAGFPLDPALIIQGDATRMGGYQAAKNLFEIDPRPTAVACINDLTAIGILHAAGECGIKVGLDLAVAGFDGIAEGEHTSPPLTTIRQPIYDIARSLVKMLATQIKDQSLEKEQICLQPELILRQSTGD